MALIRELCAKDASESEFKLFMHICRKSQLDPFKREIYFIKWETKRGPRMVIITGIEGFRSVAARDHDDYGGADAAVFTWFEPKEVTPAGRRIPESATVTVKDTKGGRTTATVWWEELAPKDLTEDRADFWNRMPKNQLEKCAEAKALRKRFPGLGNIFTREEVDATLMDQTEGGRQMSVKGVGPQSGSINDPYAYAKSQQQKLLDEKLAHGHPKGSQQAKIAEATLARVEAEDKRFAKAKKVSGAASPEKTEKASEAPSAAAGPTPVRGNLLRVIASMAKTGAARRDVQIGNVHYVCYQRSLFPFLDQYKIGGFIIEAMVDKRNQLIGLKRIGPQLFEDDCHTPITVRTREPGDDG